MGLALVRFLGRGLEATIMRLLTPMSPTIRKSLLPLRRQPILCNPNSAPLLHRHNNISIILASRSILLPVTRQRTSQRPRLLLLLIFRKHTRHILGQQTQAYNNRDRKYRGAARRFPRNLHQLTHLISQLTTLLHRSNSHYFQQRKTIRFWRLR